MLEELCKQIQHCCATLRRSQNKRNIRSCWLKSLTGFKICATTSNNMQQGVQTDATCNIQQCWELLVNNVASVCTQPKIRICYTCGCVFVWKWREKISVIKKIRIHVDGTKPIAFLPLSFPSPSSLVRLPNYCLTNLCTSMLISRFLVSSLFSFLLYFRKRVLLIIGFTILILSLLVCFLLCHCN